MKDEKPKRIAIPMPDDFSPATVGETNKPELPADASFIIYAALEEYQPPASHPDLGLGYLLNESYSEHLKVCKYCRQELVNYLRKIADFLESFGQKVN